MSISQTSSSSFATPAVALPQVAPQQNPAERVGRVLHIINGEHFSGAERVQQLLGKRLGQFGVESHFACIKPGKFSEHCQLRKNQVSDFPMRGRWDMQVVKDLAAKVEQEQFDLLHAHTPRSAMIAALVARQTQLPWIYHVHSPTSRDSLRGIINRVNYWMERYAIRSCSQLITVSKSLRREMLKCGVPRQRLTVVPNGVPAIEPIVPSQRLQSKSWKIGLIAFMRPRKGIEVALDAIHRLKAKRLPIQLELIGGFETSAYETEILNKIEALELSEHVRWTGFTNDIPTAIRGLDALLLPSLFGEGMPMVVLEALAAGVPVVATRVEGTPEVIRDGVEGFLAEPRDAVSIGNKLEQLVSDRNRWATMSQQALARHRQCFSDENMARRVARVYRKVLAQSKPPS